MLHDEVYSLEPVGKVGNRYAVVVTNSKTKQSRKVARLDMVSIDAAELMIKLINKGIICMRDHVPVRPEFF